MAEKKEQLTKVVIGPVRISYAHIFKPSAVGDSEEKKYGLSVLINKKDKKTLDRINKAIEAAKEAGKVKWGGKIPKVLKTPLRDGDEEREEDEAYKGHFFFNASSKSKPGVVDKNVMPITDESAVYSGCFCNVSINFYPFFKPNNGVAAGLNHVQFVKDGEALGGRSRVEDDFTALEDEFDGEEGADDNDDFFN